MNIEARVNDAQLVTHYPTNMLECEIHMHFHISNVIKRWSEAESFTIFENLVYSHYKNLTFAHFLVNFLAPKLIQHVIAIESIKNLDTGSYLHIFW